MTRMLVMGINFVFTKHVLVLLYIKPVIAYMIKRLIYHFSAKGVKHVVEGIRDVQKRVRKGEKG
jgi:hypothetical protein